MFPALAGMNRIVWRVDGDLEGVPRARGDEPHWNFVLWFVTGVFPALAGMNRMESLTPLPT